MANTLLWLSALLVASSGQLPSAVSPAIDEVSPQLLKHTPQTAPGKSGIEKNGIENCCAIDSSETASSRAPASVAMTVESWPPVEFLTHLFDTTSYPPRWRCGKWASFEGWLHIISDLCIWFSYITIPALLLYFARRRHDLPFHKVFFLFGAFIICCGFTHLLEAVIFW